ncbi:uncharacterized protein PG998_001294 [Apiospora kogelbergensis]|uniref:uncharacterized protein n=1 Tax=Apiospora kogelbergensis TaxID=1337665 RepID=UPI003131B839
MAQPEDVEILVHINAPSRNSDDVRYRALGSAYLAFRPCDSPSVGELPAERHSLRPSVQNGGDAPQESLGIFSQGVFPSLRSPQASFDSVIDNANSPNALLGSGGTPRTPRWAVPSQVSSWETPPSVVQDSHPDIYSTTRLFTSPTRVLEHYLQQYGSPSEAPTPQRRSQRSSTHRGTENPDSTYLPSESQSTVQHGRSHIVPTIPCTPGNGVPPAPSMELGTEVPADIISLPRKPIPKTQQKTALALSSFDMDLNSVVQGLDTTQGARADSEPPPSKRQRQTQTTDSLQGMLRTSSDIGLQRTSQREQGRPITFLTQHGYTYESLELYPAEPPTDAVQLKPEDLVTTGLRKLGSDLQIPKRFRPESQSRELRPFERGYWSLDCSNWTLQLRSEAWVFLANYVGGGVAGWGVWCRRDPDFKILKVYCWGHVVAHIFLLLYLASRRKILFTGAAWTDGENKVVIVMGKRT